MKKDKLILKIAKHISKRIECGLHESIESSFDKDIENKFGNEDVIKTRNFYLRLAEEIIRIVK